MSVKMARSAGFCRGVDYAVQTAYQLLEEQDGENGPIYMYGELIHNRLVMGDLAERGARLATSIEDIPDGAKVIIRAHGVTPQEVRRLKEKDCVVIDCTCGYVKHIHKLVKEAHERGERIIIVGDPNHPEVIGINGECDNSAVIIQTTEQAERFDFGDDDWTLVAQTTFSVSNFAVILSTLRKSIANLHSFDTICNATENRQREAEALASHSDVMLVIGSNHSSNTVKLLDICRGECGDTHLIEGIDDLHQLLAERDFSGKRIGITAGASSPESIIMEVFHIMDENETMNEQDLQQDMGDISFTDFIDNIPQLHRGATVKGVIVRYDDENVYVDVRDKTEGRIPRHEFDNNPDFDLDLAIEEKTQIDVYVRSIRSTENGKEILLSKAKVDFAKYRNLVEEAFNDKEPINVKVVNVVKDGVIASYGGVDIYVHRTQLEMGTVDDLEPYRGESFDILVTQFDPDKRRLRVSGSRRALLNHERKAKAEGVWANIAVGDIYDGIVRNLTDFGAFVDIGGVDGLVHISELSWKRIKHPSEVVKVGDTIQVYVKDFDEERKRISLGFKRIEDDPYNNIEERFPVGSIVHGNVVRMFPFGAFIEIDQGVDALCHISQISNRRLNKPDEVLVEGMEVDVRVLEVSNETRRISVSIKDVAPIDTLINPEMESEEQADDDDLPMSYVDSEDVDVTEETSDDVEEVEVREDADFVEGEVEADAEAEVEVEVEESVDADEAAEVEESVDVDEGVEVADVAEDEEVSEVVESEEQAGEDA
ncbi:MAG: bifunctional 4-hydroxy-3-methylbut-2-enyl diphosphate reductase/30S ribosomal protein S1 [Fastidiosipilaceae bacterium]|jgi:small subunit ribosomal protein S1